ncbi:hypothetical protein LCGC14_3125090, partial [marine sediment metagenome]
ELVVIKITVQSDICFELSQAENLKLKNQHIIQRAGSLLFVPIGTIGHL